MIHRLREGYREDMSRLYAPLAWSYSQIDPSINALRHSCLISLTQHIWPVLLPPLIMAPCLFPLPSFVSIFLQLFLTLSLFPSSVNWLPEHFFFPSHYNAMLILNMEPTVVGLNEWPNHSASISPSIIADWRRRGCSWGLFSVVAGGRQRWH